MGEISYITKALAAVLQLAVTMDYSIFLWHSYEEQKTLQPNNTDAMAHAIAATITAVTGSSITTIAGFIALCFMSYTMGIDLGIVMAKGVLLGVIGSVTILPSFLLIFDKPLTKLQHKSLLPKMGGLARFITKHYLVFLIAFVILLVPAIYGYNHMETYYDFTHILSSEDKQNIDSDELQFLTANDKLTENYNIATTEMILCDADLPANKAQEMLDRIDKVDGVMSSAEVTSAISSAVASAKAGESTLSTLKKQLDSYNQFYQGLSTYTAGVDSAYAGSQKLSAGADQLASGCQTLSASLAKLDTAVASLNTQVSQMPDGVSKLTDGSMQLSNGIQELNDKGISKIESLMGGDLTNLKDRVDAIRQVGDDYNNYSGIAEGMDGSVQFVFKTASIGDQN